MKRLCDSYIHHPLLVGALYAIVPTSAWFAFMLVAVQPFRNVYALRFAIALVAGGVAGALANRHGLSMWLKIHRSPEGPGTVGQGTFIGAAVGMGANLPGPLTSLIATNHPIEAMAFIIISWIAALAVGAAIGAVLACIGRQHVYRAGSAPAR